jgi:hypothetical protein
MISTTTMHLLDRRAVSLRGGDGEAARVAISLPRVAIAERRLDEIDDPDARPRWQGRPARDDGAALAFQATWRPRVTRPSAARWRPAAKPPTMPSPPAAEPPPEPVVAAPLSRIAQAAEVATIGDLRSPATLRGDRVRIAIAACAKAAGMSSADILSRKRTDKYVLPRHVAAWLLNQVIGLSLAGTGTALAGRDHTTALHSVDRVAAVIDRAGLVITDGTLAENAARAILDAWGRE